MKNTFPAFYFGPINYFADIVKSEAIDLEVCENFQKQTYRSRTNILGANGKLSLTIPLVHDGKRSMKDIKLSYDHNWQKEHFKSLRSAYLSSPYFEYYEDEIAKFYDEKETYLLDFNIKTIEFILSKLKVDTVVTKTESYQKLDEQFDFRNKYSAKKDPEVHFPEYVQVFDEKFGFTSGLSILDILFSQGPHAAIYLKNL
ncbi:WbqC family protein [Faecalibacter bovis]|uniref:WbqC family protein n=1 Tax=Faecalibacter bovis TaxID=2898187 RepID=A0ABX7XCF9_9FLAO|nr:WbqC family protein [Faecalibacter bovis]QTV05509.1 WbqC family protein [Faecalibacter bovis]